MEFIIIKVDYYVYSNHSTVCQTWKGQSLQSVKASSLCTQINQLIYLFLTHNI